MKFEVSVQVHAPVKTVWDIVSNMDLETKFWKGILSTKIIRQEGNIVFRESRLAFRNSLSKEKVSIYPKSTLKVEYLDGPILGQKVIGLEGNGESTIKVRWEVRMKGMARLFSIFATNHIRVGTIRALERIKSECESGLIKT